MIDALFIWMYFSTARKWKLVLSLTPLKPKWLSLNNVSPHPLCNSPPLFISACFWSRVQDWLRSTFYYFIGFYVHLVNNRRSHPSRIFNRDDKFPAICSKIIFEILAFLFYIVFQRIVLTFFIRFQYGCRLRIKNLPRRRLKGLKGLKALGERILGPMKIMM